MSHFTQAVWVELLKARRSRVPLLTALGFCLLPLVGGFFMVVLKDPALAQRMGLISAKAQIVAGSADWPTFLDMLAQGVAIGGFMVFGFVASWVFGREFSDGTAKDLLALPAPRSGIIGAKFVVVGIWCAGLVILIVLLGFGMGLAVRLPPVPGVVLARGATSLAVTALLTILLATPIAFFAGVGRGYLAPMGVALLMVVLAQIVAAAGWGEFFPYAIPALYAGMAGEQAAAVGGISILIVILTGAVGILATLVWWEVADQPK